MNFLKGLVGLKINTNQFIFCPNKISFMELVSEDLIVINEYYVEDIFLKFLNCSSKSHEEKTKKA